MAKSIRKDKSPYKKQLSEKQERIERPVTIKKTEGNNPGKSKVVIFLFIIVFAVYGNTIPNDYSFDDDFVTYNNPQIQKGFKAIPEIFKTRYFTKGKQNYDYRPLVKATFAVEYGFFKSNPHVSHFINVLLYFLLCVLVFLILNKLLINFNPWIAILAALIFTVHPVHTEVVASLKNRDEIMSLLGAFAAMFAFIKYVETKKLYWFPVGLLFFIFAYYSKSTILIFAAIIPLTLYFFTDAKPGKLLLIFVVLITVFWLSRFIPRMLLPVAEREILYFENPLYFQKGLWLRIGSALIITLFYLRLLVFPHPLLFYYGYNEIPIDNLGNPLAIVSLVICFALFVIALYLFKRKHLLSYAILYFFVSISIYSNILKPPPGIVAERFLLAPSFGFSLAIALLLFIIFKIDFKQKLIKLNLFKKPFIIAGALLLLYSAKTISRNNDWKNFESLYSHDIEYLNNSAKANSVYAAFLSDKIYQTKDYATAEKIANQSINYYKRAIQIYPKYSICWNNLGIIYYKFYKKTSDAISYWKEAAKCDSKYADPYFNIASAFETANIADSAIYYYNLTISRNISMTPAYSFLANLYYKKGDVSNAIKVNEQLIKADTTTDAPYVNLGNYSFLNKDTVKAIELWEKAIKKQPGNPKLCTNLSNYFRHIGNIEKADYYYNLSMKTY